MKFSMDHHFTYITAHGDEHKQQLQSYYKLTEDDLEEITKEWSADLLVAVDPVDMSDEEIPEAMSDTPGPSKTKKDDEVEDVPSMSTKTTSISPAQGGDGDELGGTEVEKNRSKVTPPREEEDPSMKRKITPPKPSSQKKSKATRTTLKTTLTPDDFDFLIVALNDVSLELAEKQEAKQEEIFNRIKGELQEVQQALQSSRAVSTVPLISGTSGTGDEPTHLHQIVDQVEAHLRRAQEDTAQATQALMQAQKALLEQQSEAEWENISLKEKWDEEKAQLLAEQLEVQERVHKALHSVTVIEVKMEDRLPQQVTQLEEVIQQLQQRITDLELRTMPETPQEIRDLREATARSAVGRLKTFALECKQLSTRSTQTYETLAENPELQTLEAQLQEAKKHADTLQA
jgi:hypothetical protein